MAKLILLATFGMLLNAGVATLIKKGLQGIGNTKQLSMISISTWHTFLTNYYIVSGIFLYEVSLIILIVLLSKGGLSIVFPLLSIGAMVIVAIISYFLLHESLNPIKLTGIVILIIGLVVLTFGEK